MITKFINIKKASILIGVTTTTLRRWEKSKLFLSNHRTVGNHRRYDLISVLNTVNKPNIESVKKTICYSRVSSHDQKEDLIRQTKVLEIYTSKHNLTNIEYITDIGSGLNFKKKGLNYLIKLILNNKVDKLILTHKDRLLRFGSDLLINVANHFNVETIILNNKTKTFEEELMFSKL